MPASFFKRHTLVCLLAVLAGFQQLNAQELSGVQNYAINRPGVVMIKTVFSANVYVNSMIMDRRQFNRLLDSIQRLDTSNIIFTAEQKLDIVLEEMNHNPNRFFKATLDYIKQPEEITSTGTGFFITGDGYVATNCHLIDRENAFIRKRFILSAFQQITEANIAALESSWATSFTEQQRNLLYSTYATVYSRLFSMILYDLKKEVYVLYSKDKDKGTMSEKKPATIVLKGLPMPGKDIAILKIDGDSTLPTLKITPDGLPQVGERLFVFGYPGPVTNNDFVSVESAIEPTLTTGIVSAIKKSVNGWPLIQMDANINHGSSGGPVCNERGEVVALTTFGSLENNGGLAAGLNFGIPVSILNEYLDTADIDARLSKPSAFFSEAIQLIGRKYYAKALNRLDDVRKLNKNYPGLEAYAKICHNNIAAGKDTGKINLRYDIMGFSLLMVLVAILYFLLKRRKWQTYPRFFSKRKTGNRPG